MMKVTIDGRTVETRAGRTILEVAREAGAWIPTLCHHPRLGPAGICRVCVVEVEGARGLVTSCNTDVRDGMVVHTATDQVREARRTIVELLLADGDHDCLSCEKSGTCELQDAAYRLGITGPAFHLARERAEIDDSHPMIVRDPNKCILCWRCIRGCNQLVVNEVLDMGDRGHGSRVVADMDAPLFDSTCVGCGECVQLCPTGALTEKKSAGRGRSWELERVRTTCPYCGVGCQMELHVSRPENRVVRVTGIEGAVPNDGMLCIKGRFGFDFPAAPERLTTPLVRKDGRHVPVSWDEALDLTATRLGEIRDEHGPDAISGVGSARDTNENNYAIMKFMRAALGTNNIDHCART